MKLHLPPALRAYAADRAVEEVSATTVGEAMCKLIGKFPDLHQHLYDDAHELRPSVTVLLNQKDVANLLEKGATNVSDQDHLEIRFADDDKRQNPWMQGELNKDEILRYSRHLIMPEVGMAGQLKLKAAKVLCVGTGGLGSPLILYLAAAGVGTIGLVDFDVVDESNLHRQIIHFTSDVGRSKLESAERKVREINPFVKVRKFEEKLVSDNALRIFEGFDIVADGTDNFPSRYLINDACVLSGIPNVYGSIFRFEGQASVFAAKAGPCYRCLYPEPPPAGMVPSCAEAGVLGILPGLIGLIQATEVIKLILGAGEPLIGRLLLVDALAMKFREMKLRKNQDCPMCGTKPTITKLIDYEDFCGTKTQANAMSAGRPEISVEELKRQLDAKQEIFVLDVREPNEYQICNMGGHLIPLGELPQRMAELDRDKRIVAHCKSGVRSGKAVDMLRQAGFTKVENLTGGILAWADRIDTKMAKY